MRFSFNMNPTTTVSLFFVISLVVSGFTIGLILFGFQNATDQRTISNQLIEEFHRTDSTSNNRTLQDIKYHITQDMAIHQRQTSIIENQKVILNTLVYINKTLATLPNQKAMISILNEINQTATINNHLLSVHVHPSNNETRLLAK